jgi:hypothetical protein
LHYQPKLDFGESAEAEALAEKRIRAERAAAFERAALSIGIRAGELGYRLAGALGVYVDSPSMRRAGLNGLRWHGTAAELAADPRLDCNADSVSRALRRFVRAGFIETAVLVDDRGRKCGIAIALNMREINAAATSCPRSVSPVARGSIGTEGVPGAQPGAGPGAGPGAVSGAYPGAGPGADGPHYIPFFPNTTVNPPPRQGRAEHGAAGVVLDPKPVPETERKPNADWSTIGDALRSVGLERVGVAIRAATEAGLEPEGVEAILGEYRANVSRLRSPGAIIDRIRSGAWPVAIRSAAEVAAASTARAAAAEGLEFEKARSAVIRRAIAAGQTLDDATADRLAAAAIGRGGRVLEGVGHGG